MEKQNIAIIKKKNSFFIILNIFNYTYLFFAFFSFNQQTQIS